MEDEFWMVQRFEEHRDRMKAVAARMLGSATEADDALQPIGQPDDAGVATADDDAAKPE